MEKDPWLADLVGYQVSQGSLFIFYKKDTAIYNLDTLLNLSTRVTTVHVTFTHRLITYFSNEYVKLILGFNCDQAKLSNR